MDFFNNNLSNSLRSCWFYLIDIESFQPCSLEFFTRAATILTKSIALRTSYDLFLNNAINYNLIFETIPLLKKRDRMRRGNFFWDISQTC
jgi:hypothetical protein